jgi:hypothetical protein
VLNRRELLATSLAGAALGAPVPLRTAESVPDWAERPMRWAQLTLVENDPGRFDLDFWLDYFRRTHSGGACLSAGGCVAYYPTKVPLHHRSAWLGNSDPFGQLVAGCRRLGMTVIARTDPHAAHQDVFDAHPDWIAVDASGKPRRHWAAPELWVTCALGPYNFEFMTEVTREIVSLYAVDGIFSNRWAGSGMCYCEHCRRNFRDFCGLELPRTQDPRDPARRQYHAWYQKRLFDLWRLWDREIRQVRPESRYVANAGGGALSELDMKTIGELAPVLFADRQARRGLMPAWIMGKNAKEYRATLGSKPIGGIFSMGVEEPYRWKDSVQSEAEVRIFISDGIANGFRPWFTKFSGTLYDRRWLKVVEDIYTRHYRVERYLRKQEPLAQVAMVYSQQTAAFYGGPQARARVEDHALGFYQALVEARIPFEMVHDGLLDAAHIDRYRVLVLPNIAALSERQCGQLREFAARGGNLVATYETSLYDEKGERRRDFGLADLFGASWTGKREGPVQNAYLNIDKDPRTGRYHPLVAGLEDATRIIHGVNRVEVKAHAGTLAPPLTLIPSYPDLPMEAVFPRIERTDIPEACLREQGRCRTVFFPWDIDRTFWEVLSPDHGRLLGNAVRWAADGPQPVAVEGAGMLDVTIWRQPESVTVHLVNLTNPMFMKGPFRELIPCGPQKVTVRLPEGRRVRRVQLLMSGQTPPTEQAAGAVTVTVPSILDHEIVAVDLG